MKIVLQRVSEAKVKVDENVVGSIGHGLLILAGFHANDSEETIRWMCDKLMKMRIFHDDEQKMNRSVQDVNGEILVVSQFTLYGDARKGNRPSFIESARPEIAIPLYEYMIDYLKSESGLTVESGEFGAMMQVQLINDGPVTILLEK
jgi:D-tyrosyl-tRNA(Tyr) deacylase